MRKKQYLIGWLLTFVSPLKGTMLLAIILGIISNLAVVAIPVIGIQQVIAYRNGEALAAVRILVILVCLGILRGLARYGEQYCNHSIAFQLLALLRQRIFRQLRLLGPAKLSGIKSGDFITAITSDVEALEVFFAHTISPVFIFLGTTLVTVVFLAIQAWQLALILLLALVITGVVIPLYSYQRYEQVAEKHQQTFVRLNQQVMESIHSIATIEQYQLGQEKLAQITETGNTLNHSYKQKLHQGTLLQISGEIVVTVTALLIMAVGFLCRLDGQTIALGVVLSLSAFGPAFALSGLGNALLTTFASGERIYQLFQASPQVKFPKTEEIHFDTIDQAMFQQVSFAYPETEQLILHEVTLSVPHGKTLGINGASGTGKSTLIKLLMRYWDPQSGNVTLNQQSLRRFTEQSLHHLEGFFEQSAFLFDDTIANNIRIGKPRASLDEIKAAAQKAAIHQWIEQLPDGYQTTLSSLSRSVSDGERQRIGLARLFLQDAPLLLLDEPTSSLDYLNELAILETIQLLQDKAVLIVSHRDTTLSIADEHWQLTHGHLEQ